MLFEIKELKQIIKEIKLRASGDYQRITRLEKELWKIKNPPKYKKGESYQKLLVLNINVIETDGICFLTSNEINDKYEHQYTLFCQIKYEQMKFSEFQLSHAINARTPRQAKIKR